MKHREDRRRPEVQQLGGEGFEEEGEGVGGECLSGRLWLSALKSTVVFGGQLGSA